MEPFQQPITCQLCSQPYTDPRMLSCLHSFCRECLHKEVGRISVQQDGGGVGSQQNGGRQQSFRCPTCEKSVSIPVGGVTDIPQNLHLDVEVKVAQYQSKIASNSQVPCDACDDSRSGPAVGFCCTCLQFLCQLCYDYHRRARNFRLHNVLSPLGGMVGRELLSAVKPSCSSHHKEFIIYCETCSSLVCQDCITSDHRDHTHNAKLPNIAKSHQDDISRFLTSAKMVKEKLTGAIDDNNRALERVEVCEETVSATIRETFKKLHQTLEDRMNELLRELHEDSLSKKTALGLQKETFEAMRQNLSHCTGIASSVLAYTDCEIIVLKQLPSTELEASINKVEKRSLIPCENSDIKSSLQLDLYHKNLLDVFSLFDSVCPEKCNWKLSTSRPITNTSFSVVVEARDLKGRLYQCNDIQVKAELALESTVPRPTARGSTVPPPSQIAAPGGFSSTVGGFSSTVPPPSRITAPGGFSSTVPSPFQIAAPGGLSSTVGGFSSTVPPPSRITAPGGFSSTVPSPFQIAAPGGLSSTVPPPSRIASSSGQSMGSGFLGFQGAQAIQRTTQTGQVSCNNNGTYTIMFTPSPAGCYDLSVTINGQHIQDSPKCGVTIEW